MSAETQPCEFTWNGKHHFVYAALECEYCQTRKPTTSYGEVQAHNSAARDKRGPSYDPDKATPRPPGIPVNGWIELGYDPTEPHWTDGVRGLVKELIPSERAALERENKQKEEWAKQRKLYDNYMWGVKHTAGHFAEGYNHSGEKDRSFYWLRFPTEEAVREWIAEKPNKEAWTPARLPKPRRSNG